MHIGMDLILMAVKEYVYFDIFEGAFLLGLVLLILKQKISMPQFIFHTLMLAILDYLGSNFVPVPILMQIVVILSYSLYLFLIFHKNYFKTVLKAYCIFFVLEISLGIIYQYVFKLQMVSMPNDYMKFIYMLPVRFVELIFLYMYYKKKRGE